MTTHPERRKGALEPCQANPTTFPVPTPPYHECLAAHPDPDDPSTKPRAFMIPSRFLSRLTIERLGRIITDYEDNIPAYIIVTDDGAPPLVIDSPAIALQYVQDYESGGT